MEPIHPKERELRLPDRAEERDPGEGPGEVFGEDRNHAGPTLRGRTPAVRPPAQGCRGRAGRRAAFGRQTGTPGRGTRRDRTIAGRSGADGHRGEPAVASGPGCRVDRAPPPPSGGEGNGGPGSRRGPVVELGPGAEVDGPSEPGSGCHPSGRCPGSRPSDGAIWQVDVGRRSGSEKLTGSPGGYSEPFPRFPGCLDRVPGAQRTLGKCQEGPLGHVVT